MARRKVRFRVDPRWSSEPESPLYALRSECDFLFFRYRLFSATFACFDKESVLTEFLDSRFSCLTRAKPRGLSPSHAVCGSVWPIRQSRFGFSLVAPLTLPRGGGFSGIPALRALLKLIAFACCADRASCLPSRTCSISSRINSPAVVDGDFPSPSSARALFSARLVVIVPYLVLGRVCTKIGLTAGPFRQPQDGIPCRELRHDETTTNGYALICRDTAALTVRATSVSTMSADFSSNKDSCSSRAICA